jgi:Glycosyltransferases involved in cell wall biogenesis
MPRASVVIPVLNREKYLPAAVESILAQTFSDWELILSDGGSRDASPDIMRDFAAKDKRIRFFSHPGTNAPEGRNAALAEARGEFVAMLDSDDVACPERLEKEIAFLDGHPEITAVGGDFDFIDSDGNAMELKKYTTRLTDPDELRRRTSLGWHCFLQSTMLFRRAALTAVGGYRAAFRYAEEDDLYYRLYEQNAILANVPSRLARYRWHGENACIPSLTTQLHRVAALGSAYCRRNGLADPIAQRQGGLDYPFLLELFSLLGDKGLAVRLFWLGLLQRYAVADREAFHKAWLDTLPLRFDPALRQEVLRHWETCRNQYPNDAAILAKRFDSSSPGTVSALLAGA